MFVHSRVTFRDHDAMQYIEPWHDLRPVRFSPRHHPRRTSRASKTSTTKQHVRNTRRTTNNQQLNVSRRARLYTPKTRETTERMESRSSLRMADQGMPPPPRGAAPLPHGQQQKLATQHTHFCLFIKPQPVYTGILLFKAHLQSKSTSPRAPTQGTLQPLPVLPPQKIKHRHTHTHRSLKNQNQNHHLSPRARRS